MIDNEATVRLSCETHPGWLWRGVRRVSGREFEAHLAEHGPKAGCRFVLDEVRPEEGAA